HQWKRQAIIVNGADVDPTVALQMKTRRVVGIEGQPYYDNVSVIAETLKKVSRQHDKFVERQALLAEKAVYA
ncbi:hypothetical protein, partial [Escherichia coli]|uniref:hypothetical protein n=1 Tax=Escherichia coli TaxID=562 RepID=UPI0013D49879